MSRKLGVAAVVALVAVAALAAVAEPAMAADAHTAGEKLGDLMRDFTTPLLGGLAGTMALGAMVTHSFPRLLLIAGMVIVIMLFLVKDSPLIGIGEETAKEIGGGSKQTQCNRPASQC
jgi:hypothetical protein